MADVSRASKERIRPPFTPFSKSSRDASPPYLPELELGGRASFFFFSFFHHGPPHLIVAVRDRNKTLVITVAVFLVSREHHARNHEFFFSGKDEISRFKF